MEVGIYRGIIQSRLLESVKNEEKNTVAQSKSDDLFITILEEDRYLKWLIDQEIADKTGRIKFQYVKSFKAPPIHSKQRQSITQLIKHSYMVVGRRPQCPLNIPMNSKAILTEGKKAAIQAGAIQGQVVKLYGTRLRYELGMDYTLKIFHQFFIETLKLSDLNIESLITPFMRERLKNKGNDTDFQIRIPGISLKKCISVTETNLKLLEAGIPPDSLDREHVYHYLTNLKAKVLKLPGYDYLKSVLQEEDCLKEDQLIRTLLKVDAFIQSADVQDRLKNPKLSENTFSIRSLGDRKEQTGLNFDYSYVSSQAREAGVFTIQSLGLYIDSLLDGQQTPLVPVSANQDEFQYFSDNNAAVYRFTTGQAEEEEDWVKSLCATLDGLRSLETGTKKSAINFVIQVAKEEQVALDAQVVTLLKPATRFHLHNDPAKIIGLTYLACLSLQQEEKSYSTFIPFIWQGMFTHLEELARFNKKDIEHPFIHELQKLLKSSFLTFEQINDFVQVFSYIGMNCPELATSSCQVGLTQDETGLMIKLRLKKKDESTFCVFLLPYEPEKALSRLFEISHPQVWEALASFYQQIIFSRATLVANQLSPIQPYSEHPAIQLNKTIEAAEKLICKDHPFAKEIGYWTLFACLKQRFKPQVLTVVIKFLIEGEQNTQELRQKILTNMVHLDYRSEFSLKSVLANDSPLIQILKNSLTCFPHQIPKIKLECLQALLESRCPEMEVLAFNLYQDLDPSILVSSQKVLFSLIKILIKNHCHLVLPLIKKINENSHVPSSVKLRILAGVVLQLSKKPKMFENQAEIFGQEICDLLERGNLSKQKLAHKYHADISKAFQKLVEQMVEQKQIQEAYQFLSLGLEQQWLEPSQEMSYRWLEIVNHFLKDSNLGIRTYEVWKLAQKFHLDFYLDDSVKEQVLTQLSQHLSDLQQKAVSVQELIDNLAEKLSDSMIYFLFLKLIQEKIHLKPEANFSAVKIKDILDAFVQLIQKNRDLSTYWPEEKNLIGTILNLIFVQYPTFCREDSSALVALKRFFTKLHSNYASIYPQELTEIFLKILPQAVESSIKEKITTSLSVLIESLLRIFASGSSLSKENYAFLISSLMRLRQMDSPHHPITVFLKQHLQKGEMETLLLILNRESFSDEIVQLLLLLESCQSNLVVSSLLMPVILQGLGLALEKDELSSIQIENLTNFYLPLVESKGIDKFKESFICLYQQLIKRALAEQNFIKAYQWDLKRKELEYAASSPFLLVKAACAYLHSRQMQSFNQILNTLRKVSITEKDQLESDLEEIFKALIFSLAHSQQGIRWILDFSLFDGVGIKNSNLISEAINNQIFYYRKISEEYHRIGISSRFSLNESLFCALGLAEKFTLKQGSLWVELCSSIQEWGDRELCYKLFTLISSDKFPSHFLTAEELKHCWKLAILSVKKIGHPKLNLLLDSQHPIFSLYQNNLKMKQETFKALGQGVIKNFKKMDAKAYQTFSKDFLIQILEREMTKSQNLDEEFLLRFKRIVGLFDPLQFLELAPQYMYDLAEPNDLSNSLILDYSRQLCILLELSSKAEKKQKNPELESGVIKLIRLLQERDEELIEKKSLESQKTGQKTFSLPHMYFDPGSVMYYLAYTFEDKYLIEVDMALRRLFSYKPLASISSFHRKFIIEYIFPLFIKNGARRHLRTIDWCQAHPHATDWMTRQTRDFLIQTLRDIHPYTQTDNQTLNEMARLFLQIQTVNEKLKRGRQKKLIDLKNDLENKLNNKRSQVRKYMCKITSVGVMTILGTVSLSYWTFHTLQQQLE